MTPEARTDVLVCGAGPSGLLLALRLARAGVRVRIVDQAREAGTTSRAIVVQARTLELYRQLGLDGEFLEEAPRVEAMNLWVGARRVAHVPVGAIGRGLSPFPFLSVHPQDRHERFLIAHLRKAGVEVERGVTLVGFTQGESGVVARLRTAEGAETTCEASWLAGADGARSKVREILGVGFPGGTYARYFYVADVEGKGDLLDEEIHIALDSDEFLALFPMGGSRARMIGTVDCESEEERLAATFRDVGETAAKRLGIEVEKVNWFSTYRVHHRVAGDFRRGRAFLLGDAAHVHSPAGAQGMNTGLGDAVNLSWKLAEVVHGRAAESILDTYATERSAFARSLVATTDRVFVIATSPGKIARFVRRNVVPFLASRLFRIRAFQRYMFRTLSQIGIRYRESALSAGSVGGVHGGDRLPWVGDAYDVGDGKSWQVRVFGESRNGLAKACAELDLPLHAFAWKPEMAKAGLTRDATYLVRPDGYVAWAHAGGDAEGLVRYVRSVRGVSA